MTALKIYDDLCSRAQSARIGEWTELASSLDDETFLFPEGSVAVKIRILAADDCRARAKRATEEEIACGRVPDLSCDSLQDSEVGRDGSPVVYLPMSCPVCGRRRLEWNGGVVRCEKCMTSSAWDGFDLAPIAQRADKAERLLEQTREQYRQRDEAARQLEAKLDEVAASHSRLIVELAKMEGNQ